MPAEPAVGPCPECGAMCPVPATHCWMCGGKEIFSAHRSALRRARLEVDDQEFEVSPSLEAHGFHRWVVVATTAVVLVGVGLESTGLATLLAFVVGLPLLITMGTAASREARYRRELVGRGMRPAAPGAGAGPTKIRPMTGGEQVGMFLKWMAVAAGTVVVTAALLVVLLAVMVISLVTALLEACGVLLHTAQGG